MLNFIRNLPLRYLAPGVILLIGMANLSTLLLMEWARLRDHLNTEMAHHARVIGTALGSEIISALRTQKTDEIDVAIESIHTDPDLIRAAVVDAHKRVISATQDQAVGRDPEDSSFRDLYEVAITPGRVGPLILHATPDNRLQAAVVLNVTGLQQPDRPAYLLMEYDVKRRAALYGNPLIRDAGYWATAIIALSILLWYFFQYRLLERVRRLGWLSHRVGQGDFSGRLDDDSRDELGELGRDFEAMAQRLERNTLELAHQAQHDRLTGLLNRWGFEQQLLEILKRLAYDRHEHALILMDLDQFRLINDTWGYTAGDEFMRRLALQIKDTLFVRDYIARFGSDEIVIFLDECSLARAEQKAEELRRMVDDFRLEWQGNSLRATCSVGVLPVKPGMQDSEKLFSNLDAACYAAKHNGRNRVYVWRDGDEELQRVYGEMRWVNRIRSALEEDRFTLYAQPIVPAAGDGSRSSYEILLRLNEGDGRTVQPSAFLSAAEHYHLAAGIDRWVIQNTLQALATRPGFLRRLDMCTINLSGLSLNEGNLAGFIKDIIANGDPQLPRYICFEITETTAITHLGQATKFIREMKQLGFRFALDDFGSGVSSFGYLKNLPVDYLKIDGIFVRDILENDFDRAVVNAINEVVHTMGMLTIAEFVESAAIREVVTGLGVDFLQGYELGRPVPLEKLLRHS